MKRGARLARSGALALLASALGLPMLSTPAHAAPLNLATLSCNKYENEILPAAGSDSSGTAKSADGINTVMWLFGYAVAKAGDHVMYGDALTSFGFALDVQCKNQPSMSVLDALTQVSPKREKPMDLNNLSCSAFESRHAESQKSDPDSATTIMMWLFGFTVGRSGSHLFDASQVEGFENTLRAECAQHPEESLFDALGAASKVVGHH
jgi:hypothetical protein